MIQNPKVGDIVKFLDPHTVKLEDAGWRWAHCYDHRMMAFVGQTDTVVAVTVREGRNYISVDKNQLSWTAEFLERV